MGHYAIECQSEKRERALTVDSGDKHVSTLLMTRENKVLLQGIVGHGFVRDGRYLDTGETSQKTGDEGKLHDMVEHGDTVSSDDGSQFQISGRGKMLVETRLGNKLIKDVLFIPKLTTNILRLGHLVEQGYKVQMKEDVLIILDEEHNVVEEVRRNSRRLYLIILKVKRKCLLT